MRWYTFTSSPALTMGFAGAPMCMSMGIVTTGGVGMRAGGLYAVCLLWVSFSLAKRFNGSCPPFFVK